MPETLALRMFGFAAGAVLHVFLATVLRRKARVERAAALLLVLVCSAGLWHICNAGALFYEAVFEREGALLPARLAWLGGLSLALAPAALLHLGLLWAGLPWRPGLALYPAAVVAWSLPGAPLPSLLGGSLAGACLLSAYAAFRTCLLYTSRCV